MLDVDREAMLQFHDRLKHSQKAFYGERNVREIERLYA